MLIDFDLCLTWRCWRWGRRTFASRDDVTKWVNHYLHIGPLSAYWRSDVAYREDANWEAFATYGDLHRETCGLFPGNSLTPGDERTET